MGEEINLDGNGESKPTSGGVFLDYNGTTPLADEVIEASSRAMRLHWCNPSSAHRSGVEAKQEIERARGHVSHMVGAASPGDIVFVSGGTEANNLVFHSVVRHYDACRRMSQVQSESAPTRPHIIVSQIEHDSVKLVAASYARDHLADVSYADVDENGLVNVTSIVELVRPNTILISLMLANNETGVIQPVGELTQRLRQLGHTRRSNSTSELLRVCPLFVHTDAAQAIGKIRVHVDELDVDYLTIVGHKFYGPRIGALYARNCLANNNGEAPISHMFRGAGQERGLRPGTENTAMIVGLGKAAELVNKHLVEYASNMLKCRDYLEQRLKDEFGSENLHFNGASDKAERLPNTCNVSFIDSEKLKGHTILKMTPLLEASTGACCHSGILEPSKILLAMRIPRHVAANALRLSVGRETTINDIDVVVAELKRTIKKISAT